MDNNLEETGLEMEHEMEHGMGHRMTDKAVDCLLYTSDAADE